MQTTLWIQNAGYIWVPFIVLSAVAAWFGMDNLATMKASLGEQITIFRRKHQWLLSWLYTGIAVFRRLLSELRAHHLVVVQPGGGGGALLIP